MIKKAEDWVDQKENFDEAYIESNKTTGSTKSDKELP